MPQSVAADVSFDRFAGLFRSGSKDGWKFPEKGFKMVSPWPQRAKMASRAYSARRDGKWPVLWLCGHGRGGSRELPP
jgi:hypothetical protein